jgi:hypothetical protein
VHHADRSIIRNFARVKLLSTITMVEEFGGRPTFGFGEVQILSIYRLFRVNSMEIGRIVKFGPDQIHQISPNFGEFC